MAGDRATPTRLIPWTGERCVPWAPEPGVIYEHLHRYLFASAHIQGGRILDLASGEGYGADLLARPGRDVVGIELDADSVQHATSKYGRENLRFETGSMLDLSRFEPASFDAITCFEALEHVVEHDELLAEIDRVLTPDGVLLISTPDRHVHTEHMHQSNPYHVRELDTEELLTLLRSRLHHVELWGQRFLTGSVMAPIARGPVGVEPHSVHKSDERWDEVRELPSTYLIAIASHVPIASGPVVSWLNDEKHEIVKVSAHALAELDVCRTQLEHVQDHINGLEEQVAAYQGHAARLEAELASVTSSRAWRAVQTSRRAVGKLRSAFARPSRP